MRYVLSAGLVLILIMLSTGFVYADTAEYEPGEVGALYLQVLDGGTPVATATATYRILDPAGSVVLAGTYSYIAGTAGVYTATIAAPNDPGDYVVEDTITGTPVYSIKSIQVHNELEYWGVQMLILALFIMTIALTIAGAVGKRPYLSYMAAGAWFITGAYSYAELGGVIGWVLLMFGFGGLATCIIDGMRGEKDDDDEDRDPYEDMPPYKRAVMQSRDRMGNFSMRSPESKERSKKDRSFRREMRELE